MILLTRLMYGFAGGGVKRSSMVSLPKRISGFAQTGHLLVSHLGGDYAYRFRLSMSEQTL